MDASPEVLAKTGRSETLYLFWCPACECPHQLETRTGAWVWNGDMVRPTVKPSLVIRYADLLGVRRCHLEIRDGKIRYRITGCTHAQAGMVVAMIPWSEAMHSAI